MPNARARGHLATDATEPDDAEGPTSSVPSSALPTSLAHGGERGQMAHERDERSEEQLGDGDGVAGRRVDDGDAERGGGVDVVGADTGAADDLEASRAEERSGHLRRAASDDGVVVADARHELRGGERRHDVHLEFRLRLEQRSALGVDTIGHEDAELHRVRPIVSWRSGVGRSSRGWWRATHTVRSGRRRIVLLFRDAEALGDHGVALRAHHALCRVLSDHRAELEAFRVPPGDDPRIGHLRVLVDDASSAARRWSA